MDKDELKKKFIVGAEVLRDRIETLVEKALKHCVVGENGTVHISSKGMGAKNQIKVVLTARSLASQLTNDISATVTIDDLVASTGLPENQIRARANELVKEHFATSPQKGIYLANAHKVEPFLDSLSLSIKGS